MCACLVQARWADDSPLLALPHIDEQGVRRLESVGFESLPALAAALVGPHSGLSGRTGNRPVAGEGWGQKGGRGGSKRGAK